MKSETTPKKKRKWNFVYLAVTLLIVVGIVLFDPNAKDIFTVWSQLNPLWILAAFGLILLYWISDAMVLADVTSYIYRPMNFLRMFKVGVIGLYYGALTPFATGGQPIQVAYMKRDDVPVGTATCIVSIKFFLYEASLCSFYVIAMLFNGAYFYTQYNQVFWLTTLGFVINLVGLIFIVLSLCNQRFVMKLVRGIFGLLAKIRILRKTEQRMAAVEKTVQDFSEASQYISRHKARMVGSYLISLLNFVFLFSVSYFIYRALGLNGATLMEMMAMQSFLYLAVAFFPTPGAAGGSEGGFGIFFAQYFSPYPWSLPMIIWRFLTYYFVVLVGALLVVFDEFLTMRRKKKSEI